MELHLEIRCLGIGCEDKDYVELHIPHKIFKYLKDQINIDCKLKSCISDVYKNSQPSDQLPPKNPAIENKWSSVKIILILV